MFEHQMSIDHEQTLSSYEKAANSGDFDQVEPLIANDALYWFTDGSFDGIDEIRRAFEATWATIHDETYEIEDIRWVAVSKTVAVCIAWTIVHEHLSKAPSR